MSSQTPENQPNREPKDSGPSSSSNPQTSRTRPQFIRHPTPPGETRLARWPGPVLGGLTRLEWELAQLAAEDHAPGPGFRVPSSLLDPETGIVAANNRILSWLQTLPDFEIESGDLADSQTDESLDLSSTRTQDGPVGLPLPDVTLVGRKRNRLKRQVSMLVIKLKSLTKRKPQGCSDGDGDGGNDDGISWASV